MFQSARLKLTGWYLLMIMAVSLLFSVTIFLESNRELNRIEQVQRLRYEYELENPFSLRPPMVSPNEIDAVRMRLIATLLFVNAGIFLISALFGYFLAGRTLKPIRNMVDEQHRFVSDASHELRTPLTSLRSELEVALRDKKIDQDTRKLLESNLEEVVALQALTNNLLTLSQNGERIQPQYKTKLPIEKIIDASIKRVKSLAVSKKIHIEKKIKSSSVLGVEERLVELFVILLDNAIKYSDKNSTVEITSRVSGDRLEVSITNHGEEIASQDLPHIFDRFYRAEKSRSETSGYGLGLSIAKKIVEAHNGKIEVNSNRETTKFTVTLPR